MIYPIVGECVSVIGLLDGQWNMLESFNHFFQQYLVFYILKRCVYIVIYLFVGGWPTSIMGVFSYITDVSTEEQRTFRVEIITLCINISIPLGMAFSGILLKC